VEVPIHLKSAAAAAILHPKWRKYDLTLGAKRCRLLVFRVRKGFLMTDHRFNVNFSDSAYEALDDLARRRGKSMADILRDAIALEARFEEARENGERVLLEKEGNVRELIWR
jgi:hypothetical protein